MHFFVIIIVDEGVHGVDDLARDEGRQRAPQDVLHAEDLLGSKVNIHLCPFFRKENLRNNVTFFACFTFNEVVLRFGTFFFLCFTQSIICENSCKENVI